MVSRGEGGVNLAQHFSNLFAQGISFSYQIDHHPAVRNIALSSLGEGLNRALPWVPFGWPAPGVLWVLGYMLNERTEERKRY